MVEFKDIRRLTSTAAGHVGSRIRSVLTSLVIDTKPLNRHERILTGISYALVALYLGLALLPDSITGTAGYVFFAFGGDIYRLPILLIFASAIGFALGWAITLTGAIYCRLRLLLPLLGFFAFALFLFGLRMTDMGLADLVSNPRIIFGLVAVVVILILYFISAKFPAWREHPLIMCGAWAAILMIFLYQPTTAELGAKLHAAFWLVMQPLAIFWIVSAAALVNVALRIGRWTGGVLCRNLSLHTFLLVIALLIALQPVLGLLTFVVRSQEMLVVTEWYFFGFSLMVLAMLLLAAFGKWNARNAQILFTASFLVPAWVLTFDGIDISSPLASMLSRSRLVPVNLLYVALMAMSIFSMAPSFLGVDGKVAPRRARVLLLLGIALLTTSAVILDLHTGVANVPVANEFDQQASALLTFGVVAVGLPYLAWLIYKHPERLVSSQSESAELRDLKAPRNPRTKLGLTLRALTALALLGLVFGGLMIANRMLVGRGSPGFLPQALGTSAYVPASIPRSPRNTSHGSATSVRIASSQEALQARLTAQAIPIRNVAMPGSPLTLYMEVPLLLEGTWCAASQTVLQDNFNHYRISLKVNDQPVDASKVMVIDTQRRGTTGYCRSHFITISDWPLGETRLTVNGQIDAPINDGVSDFPVGSETCIYTVLRVQP